MKIITKIVTLTLLLTVTACASRKKTVTPTPTTTFEWLSSKINIDAEGNNMSFNDLSGQLRMRRDSIVWLCVTATMGIEVARIKVSTDSIWFINRLEKTYMAEPLDSLANQLGMPTSLPWVQMQLLNNNEGIPPVENQTVLLKTFVMGELAAKIRYNNINLDERMSFPLKISDNMERVKLR